MPYQAALEYRNAETEQLRLNASRTDLAPWVDGLATLEPAGTRFVIEPVGPSHTPDDLAIYLPEERVPFAGDLIFNGRLPFVGKAHSRTDWSGFEHMSMFQFANRTNVYNTYLLMEQEGMKRP